MFAIRLLEEGTTQSNVTWLLWVALGFFAVIVVVGWLVSRNKKQEAEPVHEHHEEHHEEHAAHVADDLTVLEGIGPKVAMGILSSASATKRRPSIRKHPVSEAAPGLPRETALLTDALSKLVMRWWAGRPAISPRHRPGGSCR